MFNGERMVSTSDLSMIDSDLASLDSVSTNATADDLPGPGRTLGLFYSSAGRHLEVQLGKIAGRLGRGPQATALRIKKNSEVVTFVSVLPLPISMVKFKAKKIEKDCKLLLRYVGSNALSTKGQALDHIIDLSLDHHVRGLLKAMGAVRLIKRAKKEIFLRDDYDASILSRSHKALVSVADDTFMQDIKDLNESHMRIFNRTLNVWAYVRDPNRSFLVIRWVAQLGWFTHLSVASFTFHSNNLLLLLNCAIDTTPEWDYVDQLLELFLEYVTGSRFFKAETEKALEIVVRHADKLPRTIGSKDFLWFMKDPVAAGKWLDRNDEHTSCTVHLLCNFAHQSNTEDFSCIDWDHIRGLYPHSELRPLFTRLLNTPDIIFLQIAHERIGSNSSYHNASWVVRSETLRRLSQELAVFTDSEDQLLSGRAKHWVASLLEMDIYCRKAILEALSTTRYARTPEFAMLIKTQEVQSTTLRSYQLFNRHCDADGKLVHVCDPSCSEKRAGETKYHLSFDLEAVLQLRVQRGEAFSIVGHRPIVAGCTTSEELAYIAMACYSKRYGQRHCACAVTEGTKPENLRFQVFDYETGRSQMRAPESFVVYVLRYEAAVYADGGDLDEYGAEGLDPTGPFAWRPMKQEDISPPQAFVEEVQADREGSESDEEDDAETDSEENESDEEVWETADEGSVFSTG